MVTSSGAFDIIDFRKLRYVRLRRLIIERGLQIECPEAASREELEQAVQTELLALLLEKSGGV